LLGLLAHQASHPSVLDTTLLDHYLRHLLLSITFYGRLKKKAIMNRWTWSKIFLQVSLLELLALKRQVIQAMEKCIWR